MNNRRIMKKFQNESFGNVNLQDHSRGNKFSQRSYFESSTSRNKNVGGGYVPTPRYDFSDYEGDVDTNNTGYNSPIGWICDAGKDYICPGSDNDKKCLFDLKSSTQGQGKNFDVNRSRKSQERVESHGTDDEISDGEEIITTRLRHGQGRGVNMGNGGGNGGSGSGNGNGMLRTPQSSYSNPDISIPSIKLYTPGGPLSEFSPSVANQSQESRIVAPNVGKLAPGSVVEIRLQSIGECVAVLCSVDVLKMRSGFLGEILDEQESDNKSSKMGDIWRDPIIIPEASPFEAAAFLESLHEGRALFKEEWNFCWARLSVNWIVEDLVNEYASQIDIHINKLINLINQNSWRTNQNILEGNKVATIRKGIVPIPTIQTAKVLEINANNQNYSKLKVIFDLGSKEKEQEFFDEINPLLSINFTTTNSFTNTTSASNPAATMGQIYGNGNLGEITEPLWVYKEPHGWIDPDELFMIHTKKLITVTDKRVFWEMARSIIDLPQLAGKLQCPIKSSKDLAGYLKRPEYKVLWSIEAPNYLPKDAATELLTSAYCQALPM